MKTHKELGKVLEIEDLNRAPLEIRHVTSLSEIVRNGSVQRVSNDLGVMLGGGSAYLMNLSRPARPEIISRFNISQDSGGYANSFLGIYRHYALFSIGYEGIEIIDIINIHSPMSLGIVEEYKPTLKMCFNEDIGITASGIYDISDIQRPQVLKKYETHVYDFELVGGSLILSCDTGICSIKMNKTGEYPIGSWVKNAPFCGLSKINKLVGKYLLAASNCGMGIIEITPPEEKLELRVVVKLEIDPNALVMAGALCLARTIPHMGNMIISFSLVDPLHPMKVCVLDVGKLLYIAANEDYIGYLCMNESKGQRLTVLKAQHDAPHEYIGVIEMEMSSTFSLLDNTIYVFDKNDVKVFEINAVQISRDIGGGIWQISRRE